MRVGGRRDNIVCNFLLLNSKSTVISVLHREHKLHHALPLPRNLGHATSRGPALLVSGWCSLLPVLVYVIAVVIIVVSFVCTSSKCAYFWPLLLSTFPQTQCK